MTKYGQYGEPRETYVVVEHTTGGPVLKYISKKVRCGPATLLLSGPSMPEICTWLCGQLTL